MKEGIRMLKKKSAAVILALILLIALGGQALAAGDAGTPVSRIIAPLWVNIDQAGANLTFTGSLANCSAYVIGKTGTSRITGKAVLARRNSNGTYTTVCTWSNLASNSRYLDFSGSSYVTTGYTYRLAFTATVYRNGSSETVTAYSSASA
jgi:hypothetical protein